MSGEADSHHGLIQRCLLGEEQAWSEFVRAFQPVIALGVIKVARAYGDANPDTVDDLIQQTYLKACAGDCRLLRQFVDKPSGELKAYLRVVAANLARDHFADRYPERNTQSIDALMERTLPGADTAQRLEFETLLRQLDAVIDRADLPNKARDRTVFWLYYRSGLTAQAIAAIPAIGMSTKAVESLLHRMIQMLRQAMVPPAPSKAAKGSSAAAGLEEGGCS